MAFTVICMGKNINLRDVELKLRFDNLHITIEQVDYGVFHDSIMRHSHSKNYYEAHLICGGKGTLIADEEEAETFTYVLKDGKIASYVDAYGTSFRLEYTDNYLTSVIGVYEGENEDGEIEKEEYPVEYKYTDNNLVAIDGGGLKFGEQKNITNGVDPVICIYKFILTAITENSDFFPHLLGLCGNSSANLPTSSDVIYGNLPFTYTYEIGRAHV